METTTEKNQLVSLIEENGLEKTKAQVLLENFQNYFEVAAEWEAKAKALVITDASQLTEMKQAREGRLFLVKKRTAIESVRKKLKEDSLREGRTIDAIAKVLTNLIEPIEKDLKDKEEFAERLEAERKAQLKAERAEKLSPYVTDVSIYPLGDCTQEAFDELYNGAKLAHEKRIEDARISEEKRLAEIEAEKKRQEELRLENERLKKEAEEREKLLAEERAKAEAERKAADEKRRARADQLKPYIVFIRDYSQMIELPDDEFTKQLAEIDIAAKEHYKYEAEQQAKRAAEEAARQKEQEEQAAKIEAERLARIKAEAELKAKKEAEERAAAEEAARVELELSKGDSAKYQDLISDLETLKTKYTFKSKKHKTNYANIVDLLNKTINYAISKQ